MFYLNAVVLAIHIGLFPHTVAIKHSHKQSSLRYKTKQAPSKVSGCFLQQETLLSLLSTGWFQERDSSVIYITIKNACFTIELK